jgi:phospholipid/cholesterol/gamma-HCH transport system ATP-binding protein
MHPLISLRGVWISMGGFDVLKDITIDFPEGKSAVIMGPSGCGKSTLLKVAAGLIPPDRGRVLYIGEDILRFSERRMSGMRKRGGFVFQDAALWENKSIFDNLALPVKVHFPDLSHGEVSGRVERALEKASLIESGSLRPARLSIGERKVISFLRALMTEPEVVFLDEPTLSVDHTLSEKILMMIRELKNRSCTIIAVTYDPRIVSLIADTLVVLESGRMLAAGDFDEVKASGDPRVREILSQVLGEAAAYDTDILALLGEKEGKQG